MLANQQRVYSDEFLLDDLLTYEDKTSKAYLETLTIHFAGCQSLTGIHFSLNLSEISNHHELDRVRNSSLTMDRTLQR